MLLFYDAYGLIYGSSEELGVHPTTA